MVNKRFVIVAALCAVGCSDAEFQSSSIATPSERSESREQELEIASGSKEKRALKTEFDAATSDGSSPSDDRDADLNIDEGQVTAVRDLCESRQHETLSQLLYIPASGPNCIWDAPSDDNVGGVRRYPTSLDLPDEAVVCDVDLEFESQQFEYDDQIVFTFNDYVLAASYFSASYFVPEDDLLKWTDDIVGKPFSETNYSPWCLGKEDGSTTCSIPESEDEAAMALDIDESYLQAIGEKIRDTQRLEFSLAVLGGNEPDRDCSHSGLEFRAQVAFVIP